jgi:histidine triad (HIT) family protein
MSTVFGKIIRKELPATIVYEDDLAIAFKDIHPQAPVHLLIVPKKEFKNLQNLPKEDLGLISHIVMVAQKLAKEYKIEDNYRFLTNNGEDAGQSVWHLHFHLIGGKQLGAIA